MNPEQSRLRQEERSENTHSPLESSQQAGLEFQSVEELLKHDSEQNPVPPELAERLNKSISTEIPGRSWIKRWFN